METTKVIKKTEQFFIVNMIPLHNLHNDNEKYKNNYMNAFVDWYEKAIKFDDDEKYFEFIKTINSEVIKTFFAFLEMKDINVSNQNELIKEFNNDENYYFDWIEDL